MTGETMEILRSLDVDGGLAELAQPFHVELRTKSGTRLVECDPLDWEAADYAYRTATPQPRPKPSRQLVTEPSLLRQLGETKPVVMREYDLADPAYLLEVEQWRDGRAFAVLAHCLRLELHSGGRLLTGNAERASALRKLGITNSMAWQLFQLIERQGLAREAEATGFSAAASAPMEGAGT